MGRAATALLIWLAAAGVIDTASAAGGLQIAPTTIELPAEGGNALLNIGNLTDGSTNVQIEGFAWSQTLDGDVYTASPDFLVSPPVAAIVAGKEQVVRVRVLPRANANGERAFRLFVSELPKPGAVRDGRVQMLLQFSIPVFCGPAKGQRTIAWRATKDASGIWLAARNNGSRRVKLLDVKISESGGKAVQVAGGALIYLLAGSERRWRLDGVPPHATNLSLTAQDGNDQTRFSVPLIVGH